MGAAMQCTFGATIQFVVLPVNRVMANYMPVATAMENAPMVNLVPAGVCTSLANPTVASATTAAMGVLTPMPCVPVIPGPWAPGSLRVKCNHKPMLNSPCMLNCAYGGVITITSPGQFRVQCM